MTSSATEKPIKDTDSTAGAFTPGPYLRDGTTIYALDDNGKVNRFSANVQGGHVCKAERTSPEELTATARELVHRFNCHDDLYEALKAMIQNEDGALKKANAAIAKAENRS